MKRQLAAILYADVAGYSRLTGINAEQTHQQLNTGLSILEETISKHEGHKVHEAGDAILAEFPSVTEAVNAAVEMQKTMATRESDLPEDQQVKFRIGVNIGEIIHDRGDIYGDGVNITARIQEIAEPGNLCISSAVYEQLAGHEYGFDDLGFRDFKNIERPVHVYQLRLDELLGHHPMQALESRVMGQPLFDDTIEHKVITRGRCSCGSNRFEITQPPLGTGFCHCRICQRNTGAPVFAWTAFPIGGVKFLQKSLKYFRLSRIGEHGFCEHCGTSVIWRGVKPDLADYVAITTTCLDDPENYAPTWHGGIESQLPWLDIHDDLPRKRCTESPLLHKAWKSAGIDDTKDWKALDYEDVEELGEHVDIFPR